MKCLWCVCGGEYLLRESIDVLHSQPDATVAVSSAAEEVCRMYGLLDELKGAREVILEGSHGRSAPIIMRLHSFDAVVVAPCSANTAAKIAHGVADSLVSNIVAQALKSGVRVIMLPTDAEPEVIGRTVSGKEFRIRSRQVDISNVEKLRVELTIVKNASELASALRG